MDILLCPVAINLMRDNETLDDYGSDGATEEIVVEHLCQNFSRQTTQAVDIMGEVVDSWDADSQCDDHERNASWYSTTERGFARLFEDNGMPHCSECDLFFASENYYNEHVINVHDGVDPDADPNMPATEETTHPDFTDGHGNTYIWDPVRMMYNITSVPRRPAPRRLADAFMEDLSL